MIVLDFILTTGRHSKPEWGSVQREHKQQVNTKLVLGHLLAAGQAQLDSGSRKNEVHDEERPGKRRHSDHDGYRTRSKGVHTLSRSSPLRNSKQSARGWFTPLIHSFTSSRPSPPVVAPN